MTTFAVGATPVFAQAPNLAHTPIPAIVQRDGRYALMVDGAPYLVLGAQIHNSSAWPAAMAEAWPALDEMHINTLEAPVYWEALEPEPGRFDFAQVDMLIEQSRTHHVRLILLWFGTWKNGSGHYIPQWMKRDERRFPHVIGPRGTAVDSLSPHSADTLAADQHAFAALMRHLKAKDTAHTVIMMQVENEPGTWGAKRDYSATAEQLFQQDVPAAVLKATGKQPGSWSQVFGDQADGFFHSWSIARYIDQVAAAGSAEYPLPMYVNVALRDPIKPGKQGSWESGGATDDVLDVWKAAAPHIAVLAPDIYSPEFEKYTRALALYQRPDNPLLVPESGRTSAYARYCFAAFGRGAIGWAPFGVDRNSDAPKPAPNSAEATADEAATRQFRVNFEILQPLHRRLARLQFEDKLQGAAESEGTLPHVDRLTFGDWTAVVTYGRPRFGDAPQTTIAPPVGEALIAQTGPDEFLVMAYTARIDFEPTNKPAGIHRQFIAVEEGSYAQDAWKSTRIWNGDETDWGLNFGTGARLLRVKLATY